MKCIACLLVASLLPLIIGAAAYPATLQQDISEFYSFENDLEGWTTKGTDLVLNEWSITRSQDMAKEGSSSLKLDLFNRNDAGKIWVEKAFTVKPNQIYQASVEYALASAEFVAGTAWVVITGVLNKSPQNAIDLGPAYKDGTQNNRDSSGFAWTKRGYDFTVRSDERGMFWVVVGVAGTTEAARGIYYVDKLRVTLTKKPEGSQFYSFEKDMEGWTANGTDLELSSGLIDSSVTRDQALDGSASIKLDLNNLNGKGKVWIEKAFVVEPRQIYRVQVDYSFVARPFTRPFFKVITGVLRNHPQTADDLTPAYQDDADVQRSFGSVHRSYQLKVKSKKSDMLYVVIGIWGTEQEHRTYWFGNVCVTLTKQ